MEKSDVLYHSTEVLDNQDIVLFCPEFFTVLLDKEYA